MADPKKAEAAASVKKTLVEEGTEFKGSIVSKCPVAVSGRVEGEVIETAEMFVTRGGRLVRGDGFPPHEDRFARAGIDVHRLLAAGAS